MAESFQQQGAKLDRGWSYKGENFQLTYDMQVELARRFYKLPPTAGGKELSSVVFEWVNQKGHSNARNFRNFVEDHPDIVPLFKNNPEAALSQIESAIYEAPRPQLGREASPAPAAPDNRSFA